MLVEMVKTQVYEREGKTASNFELTLPPLQSELAK